jgi:hypothetical protein
LERCYRAAAGRRLQRDRAPVPVQRPRRRRRALAPEPRPPDCPDGRRQPLLRRPDHHGARSEAPNVVSLVYVAAFALDEGESLASDAPPPPALAKLDIDEQGYAWNSEDGFINHFASDVDPVKAKVLFAVQQPFPIALFGEAADVMGVPAWKSLPCWYLVTTEDEAIPPDAQRHFAQRMNAATVEVKSNHLVPVTHPDDTAKLIETAAQTARVAA